MEDTPFYRTSRCHLFPLLASTLPHSLVNMESILHQGAESFTCAWSSSTKIILWNSNPTKILMYFHWKHLKSLVEKKTQKLNSTHLFELIPVPLRSSLFFSVAHQQPASAFSWDNQVPSIDASWLDWERTPGPETVAAAALFTTGRRFFWEGRTKISVFSV